MSPALSGSSALQRVKLSDALEICNKIRKERGEEGKGRGGGGGGGRGRRKLHIGVSHEVLRTL